MDPLLIKAAALLAVMLFVCKRSIFGPQKNFARLSLALIVSGVATLYFSSQKDDIYTHVGAVFVLIGMMTVVVMLSVEIGYTARKLCAKKTA